MDAAGPFARHAVATKDRPPHNEPFDVGAPPGISPAAGPLAHCTAVGKACPAYP
jgi:hypothetical protein